MTRKEEYVFIFPTEVRADYWFHCTAETFSDDVIKVNNHFKQISFPEGSYWFMSEHTASMNCIRDNIYTPEMLYIILDDFERTKLDTYQEMEGAKC